MVEELPDEAKGGWGVALGYFLIGLVALGSYVGSYLFIKNQSPSEYTTEVPLDEAALSGITIGPSPSVEDDFAKYKRYLAQKDYLLVNEKQIVSPPFSSKDEKFNATLANEFLQKEFFRISGGKEWETRKNVYLYLRVSAGNDGPLRENESIYIVLNEGSWGGHLLKSKSLLSDPLRQEFLYKISALPLTTRPYSDANAFQEKNWQNVIAQNINNYFGGFVSTTRGGQIEEVIIAWGN